MEAALSFVNEFLGYGANVVLPVIMFLLCLALGMKWTKALSAGLLLGIAFTGMNILFGFAFPALQGAGHAMIARFPTHPLTAYDLGWTVASVISWAWPYAVFMFPLQIVINAAMLALGWTQCLNVDMWNVWHKATLGAFVSFLLKDSALGASGALAMGFVVGGLWVVLELISADYTREQVYNLTKIPGIAVSHNMLLDIVWMAPILDLIERIPALKNIKTSPEDFRRRFGILGENYILGAIMGLLFGVLAGFGIKETAVLVVSAAAILTIFPMMAGLFARALAPVAEGAQAFMQKRFPGKAFYVGLDWPVLGGIDALWVTGIITAPFILLFAAILPYNITLPFGSIIAVSLIATTTVVAQGDVVKSSILSIIGVPVYLGAASFFAPYLTNLAKSTGVFDSLAKDAQGYGMVTWLETNAAGMRLMVFAVLDMINGLDGNRLMLGVGSLVVLAFCGYYYVKAMKRRENMAAAASGGISGSKRPYKDAPTS